MNKNICGAKLIARERKRQIEEKGHTAENDRRWTHGQLSKAAAIYASPEPIYIKMKLVNEGVGFIGAWPWQVSWYKPKGRIRDLARAGALIAAEIDRLQELKGE